MVKASIMNSFRNGVLILLTAFSETAMAQDQVAESLLQYVKPIIGTQRMGHTYPGATFPFGMVQLSPDTDTLSYETDGKYNPDVYKYCAGYQYDDPTIIGFSHTHLSGTGHSDLGDFLIMPTIGPRQLSPGVAHVAGSGFRSHYQHANEIAEADYYRVRLDDHNILAELTASPRVGMHRYTFPATDSAAIILDLMSGIYNYPDKNVWTYVRIENDTLITGYRQTHGWARTRTLYFAMSFSRPFRDYGCKDFSKKEVYKGFWGKFDQSHQFPELAGKQLRAWFRFAKQDGNTVLIKFALSPVSTEGALKNMRTEIPGWNFDQVRKQGQTEWNNELSRIRIDASTADKENFYTAMYHAFINPTLYMDVDHQYKGLDQGIHTANGFTNYTTFSLWDTYRALHPLFTIIQTSRNADMVQSMLSHYDQSSLHMLPIWSNSANENWCMTGYHAVAVLADAVVKNTRGIDGARALEACITTANRRSYDGIGLYLDKGYIPVDLNGNGVSTTLEYAYDDWAIAQLAQKLHRDDVYQEFLKRSNNYRNVFDKKTRFMHARLSDGSFKGNFDPLSTSNQGFIEGNGWNYSLFVPQDPKSLMELMGGDKAFIHYLDTLFTMQLPDAFFAETEDITRDGIIGGYVHGNEPSHHVAYLYDATSQPWKTQERVRMILKNQYRNTADGLGGNDDCGQMSAWYIFSSLGFYPLAPGSGVYQIGSPSINSADLQLENGKHFRIMVRNQGPKQVYVERMELNGKPLTHYSITHEEIMNGGTLTFYMSAKHPN